MKNARGHILLLHQKGSSPLGLQPVNKCYFLRNHISCFQEIFFSRGLISSSEELLEIQGIHTGPSEIHVVSWRFGDSIASSGFSVVGISEFWDGNGFLGRGIAPAGWREMRTLLSIFPNPKHPENILQPSRKHITGFQKTLPTLQKTSSKVFRKNLSPSKKYLSSLSRKHLSKVSSNPILSLQKANYKHPEIHLAPITKNHDSKI